MKQQAFTQKRFSSGSAEFDPADPTPSLADAISKTFTKNTNNKLLFASQSVSMIKPIALAYLEELPLRHEPFNCQLILIDFSELEIDYLQETLRKQALKQARKDHFEPDVNGALNIVRMNSQQVQKRKTLYLKPGLLSISSQVFLTDLLRGWSEGNGLKVKIVLKMGERVSSYYHYQAWLTTILKIKQAKEGDRASTLSTIYLCHSPHHYSDENQLLRIYRTFFCKQAVIWPFGRAEIHKALLAYRQKNKVKEYQHNLAMSEGQRKIHETLMELFYFLKKRLAGKTTNKSNGEHILYSNAAEEGYQFAKGELTEFEHVKLLLLHLESSSKLSMLNLISKFVEMKECEIWNSNNIEAINLIESLNDQLELSFFIFQKLDTIENVELIRLFNKLENVDFEVNFEKEKEFVCAYPLYFKLQVKAETNQKLSEVIRIIQNIKHTNEQKQNKSMDSDQILDEATQRLILQLKQNHPQQDIHNVLIICGLKSVERYVKEGLEGYITDNSYFQYLRNLHRYLHFTRNFRMKKIKKIYERRKVKKGDANAEGSKKGGDRHAVGDQNRQILKQILYQELQKLHQIICKLEVNLGIINNNIKQDMNSQDTFQNNRDEAKIIESFNQDILTANFTIIDISKIKATYLTTSIRKFIFQTNGLKKRVFVDHEDRHAQPNYFHQLLSSICPSTVIFYTPNPLLLRSLYLFRLENPNHQLKQIHILSYENCYEIKKASFEVTRQDKAFWNISQNRSKLPQFIESPFLRVRNINFRDSIQMARHHLNSKSLFREEGEGGKSIGDILSGEEIRRKVLVDTREFKSSLPSYLYHFGFDIVPVFLKTSDYVLSDDTAIQKKSVHTRDLHNSLKNFRLQQQLKRMCSRFRHPYLLIECQQETDFVKSNFGYLDGSSGNKGRFELRKKIMQIMHRFPSVRLLWSSSVEQSCQFIRLLKEDKLEPDLAKFIKQQSQQMQDKGMSLSRVSQASQKRQQEDK